VSFTVLGCVSSRYFELRNSEARAKTDESEMISSTLSPLPNSEEKEEVVDPATLVNQETIKNIRTCMKKWVALFLSSPQKRFH
jgi:hypothetical protein